MYEPVQYLKFDVVIVVLTTKVSFEVHKVDKEKKAEK